MEAEFLTKLSEVLELETSAKPEDRFRDYEVWDSLAHLSVISFVDEEYDIVIPRDLFRDMNTVQDIYDYILAHRES